MAAVQPVTILKSKRLTALPPEWPQDLLPEIQSLAMASGRKVVVLDDDPTGTQTVHGIPVLTEWSLPSLESELEADGPGFYLLTNSRSLPLERAKALNREIGVNLRMATENTAVPIEVISRSDSTLRGHFPGEVDELVRALGLDSPPYLIIPFFWEGERYTIDNIHYVGEGEKLVPAGETPYARDAVFGYQSSDLRAWVEEKTGGKIPAHQVGSVTISDIREGGPQRVKAILLRLASGTACIVNAASYRDVEVVVMGLLLAEAEGFRCLPRTAASFVRVRMGIQPRPLLDGAELPLRNKNGGLFVVGSYVPKTTAQVSALLEQTSISNIEVQVEHLLDDVAQEREITQTIQQANTLLQSGQDVVIYTSRNLVTGSDPQASLSIGQRISDCLVAIVRGIQIRPRYIVAKGGITSSDIATKGLRVRRALVMGQILPGVPVWKLGAESRYPDMPYIVFPGNVGEKDALVQIQRKLEKAPC